MALQSHYLAVGAAAPWATPGVGAGATQATVNISYGPRALELLQAGCDAQAALGRLIAADEGGASRQLAEAQLVAGDHAKAAILFERACELAPDSHELLFSVGVSFAQMGDLDADVERVRRAIDRQPNWMMMLDRLPAEIAPVGAALIARLNSE